LSRESLENGLHGGMQMTAAAAAGAPLGPIRWDAIHWPTVHDQVRRLQVRIAKAAGNGANPGHPPSTGSRPRP